MGMTEIIKTNLQYEKALLKQAKRIKIQAKKANLVLKGGSRYKKYYMQEGIGAKLRYIQKQEMKEVYKIKTVRFLELYKKRLEKNIRLQQDFLAQYAAPEFSRINAMLPKAYQFCFDERMPLQNKALPQVLASENPYRREDLIHKTSYGLQVRSKGEIMIAEILYAAGFEFYYEKALKLMDENGNVKVVYPDFTILLGQGKIVYWEHKGMMGNADYFLHDQEKMLLYYQNDIYEPKNLIVTKDGADGSFDFEAIQRLVYGFLLPLKA